MATFVWLGDEDASKQVITHHGLRFVKGEPTKVDDKATIAKLQSNAMFAENKGEVIESEEPPKPDMDAGTEREAVMQELDALGVDYDGRAKIETLRANLAKAKA